MKPFLAALVALALLGACTTPPSQTTPRSAAKAGERYEPFANPEGAISWTVFPNEKPCVFGPWQRFLAPGPQTFEKRPQFPLGDGSVLPLVFGPLKGEFAKRYMFMRVDAECERSAVVVGSYEATTAHSRESGNIGPNERLYHSDLYTGGAHYTLGFYTVPPSYDAALALAKKHLR